MTVVLCPATVSALRGNTVLTELRLYKCYINAEGTSHLAQALCDITTLTALDLSENTVDSQGARHLGKLSGGVWGYGLTVTSDCVSVLDQTGRGLLSKMYGGREVQHLTSIICHPSSVICHLSSVIRHPSSDIRHPTSVIRHPSSVIRHLVFSRCGHGCGLFACIRLCILELCKL